MALDDVTTTTPGLDGPTHEEAKTLTETTVSVPTSFADLGVREDICQALEGVGIVSPFPIQAMSIPIAVEGTDLIGQARTGTGKTLAFGITILQRITLPGDEGWEELTTKGKPQALVMCPTRELALQVSQDISTAASVRGARVLTVYGGVGYEPQIDALQAGVDVVVGTPGRLLDLSQRKNLDLSHVHIVVLDEADEMLDLGFLPDVENLIGRTPTPRQTMLFSATMPAPIMALARSQLNRPVHVRAEGADTQATVPDTQQFVYQAHPLDKIEIIGRILQANDAEKVIIFCRTKRACQRLSDDLNDRGFKARAIHGDLTQVAREKALKRFRHGDVTILVATDVAARGIDVTGVSHVINHECPEDEKTYVHRIGRTGRAGTKGVAVTLVDWADVTRWKLIDKALNLELSEPVETYSTSPHLYTDLDIPEDARGKIAGAGKGDTEKKGRQHHHSHSSSGKTTRRRSRNDSKDGGNTRRNRIRRRNGKVVRGSAPNSDAQRLQGTPHQERRPADRSNHDVVDDRRGTQPRRRRARNALHN
ncbi:DEAD/DEAH box helicase [Propionibacterium sp. NM47_B9-13]|uniref:RNA helicase n=2 Tax=Cutibacterium modestum TaxID=2559073 RepID=A0AAD1KPY4_9ACTN|nr:DEAD/DEAH box helicase [Cutibacterium modestum]TGY29141.1 DEAD/DEAH box helicase [Propionibacterium sp. NM47_B9-13]AOH45073.1 RNA helicase [Cutibacterium modestum]EFS91349.1 DEAD/DEAH box helicase [Cutibacterium modestum HL044PA1]EGG27557.1 putative ATP-dependent RNA helicase DeaD [Cutibacterium modestum P08]REB74620.1 ATP-dependent helicase [Cutibacterium modestum]